MCEELAVKCRWIRRETDLKSTSLCDTDAPTLVSLPTEDVKRLHFTELSEKGVFQLAFLCIAHCVGTALHSFRVCFAEVARTHRAEIARMLSVPERPWMNGLQIFCQSRVLKSVLRQCVVVMAG